MSFTKKIYDSVHGFIHFNELEGELIDTLAFQRLHYIRQLGMAYLVYPGATHTRFEHSLGVMELASRIFDRVFSKYQFFNQDELNYWKQILRLAALCHDLGHLPFSHTAEVLLLGKKGHERWSMKMIQGKELSSIWRKVEKHYQKNDVISDIIKISLGDQNSSFSPVESILSQIISGDFFGADRIDYLLRDAQCTGVSYGLFDSDQLIETLCILPQVFQENSENRIELGIEEQGIESCEALLLARHFMQRRVYHHPSVRAYGFHLARFMRAIYELKYFELESYLSMTDNEILSFLQKAHKDVSHPGHKDALSLLFRAHRFFAIEISEDLQEEKLEEIKDSLNLSDEEIAWETSSSKQMNLSFPVLKRDRTIVSAADCSKLLIPLRATNWLFFSPHHEKVIEERLASYSVLH